MMFLFDGMDTGKQNNPTNVIDTEINFWGQHLRFRIGAEDSPARLSDIVPLAYAVSDKLCSTVIETLCQQGQGVSCERECSFCCEYLVSLSIPEVYYLQERISEMDDIAQTPFLQSCLESARKILDVEKIEKYNITDGNDLSRINKWYKELELTCPFLINGLCTIYDKRPLACREHMVTSFPQFCQKNQEREPEFVEMYPSVLEVLGQLSAELEETEVEAVFLSLIPFCKEYYTERSVRTWPAVILAQHFMRILKTMALKYEMPVITAK